MKEKFVKLYMKLAGEVANLSVSRRSKVGCVIVKNNNVISMGYNGTPAGWDNNCENELIEPFGLVTKPEVCHSEFNSIGKLAREGTSSNNADLFITLTPCFECAKLIHVSGIRKVWYRDEYRDLSGLEFLKNCGIETEKVEITE